MANAYLVEPGTMLAEVVKIVQVKIMSGIKAKMQFAGFFGCCHIGSHSGFMIACSIYSGITFCI
jgi:hypothetical protein